MHAIKKDIVITGIGVISPIGTNKKEYWNSIKEGSSSYKKITLFDTEGLKVNVAGQVPQLDIKGVLPGINARDFDRATIFLSAATKQAIDDSGIEINETTTAQTGVSVGTTFGSLYSISEFDKESVKDGPKLANPSVFTSTVGNSPASRISINFKIKGLNATLSTGMSAALDAIEYAKSQINSQRAQTMIAGTVEVLSPQIFLGFYKLNYLSDISCPFDKRRNGVVLSEGAAVFILEDKKEAKKRKANIYAKILGSGSCFDPAKFYNYNPVGTGMKEAMRLALKDAKTNPNGINAIFANANSTKDADLIETNAIKKVFGKHAPKIPICAIKSTLGETYSASGGMALAAAIGALAGDSIPPTINLENSDSDCDLDYVPNRFRAKKISRIMINAFGPNGDNTSLIIGRG